MTTSEQDRLASLFRALASTADLAGGFHSEKAIRTAVLATRLAAACGLPTPQQSDVFYLALAEDEAAIREHAELSGFPATVVTEETTVIDPTTQT